MKEYKYIVAVKSDGEWKLEVCAAPFGDVNNKDSDGDYFTNSTDFYLDKIKPMPIYYHGYKDTGVPQGKAEVIGETKSYEVRSDGVWLKIVLDKASDYAKTVWEAAKNGIARASSGTLNHLIRKDGNGHITAWPMAEISLFELTGTKQPANQYAVALPALKTLYKEHGMVLPEDFDAKGDEHSANTKTDSEPADNKNNNIKKENDMTKEELAALKAEIMAEMTNTVADGVKVAVQEGFKARDEMNEAEKKAADDKLAMRAEIEKEVKAELAEKYRLDNPTDADFKSINIAKFNDMKFNNLDAGDHSLMLGIMRQNNLRPSETAIKSLAAKMEEDKSEVGEYGRAAMKMRNVKANEVDYSTYSSYGDEWVGAGYSNRLWEKIRTNTFVVDKLAGGAIEVPQGYESVTFPLESTDPIFYKVAQATAIESTLKVPQATVTNSPLGTDNNTITLAKMGGRVIWTGEMSEDSLIPFMPQLRAQLAKSGAEYLESAVLDGDTETSASTNINDIAGTPAATDWFMTVDGMRKAPLITTTANSRSAAGSLDVDDFLETVKLMGSAGINALDRSKVEFIIDPNVHYASLKLPEVKTRDVFSAATLEAGKLTGIWGYNINISGQMCKASAVRKSNTAGKVDVDTTTNNLYGSILATRWDQWKMAWRRRMTIEVTRIANADAYEIVAMMRFGLKNRDTEASAITYYVGV